MPDTDMQEIKDRITKVEQDLVDIKIHSALQAQQNEEMKKTQVEMHGMIEEIHSAWTNTNSMIRGAKYLAVGVAGVLAWATGMVDHIIHWIKGV